MSELISFFREMLETSRERIKTPITGAFIFSFIAYNWKPIVVFIYSKRSIENTVELISSEYCSYWAIIIPLFISIAYTIILPYGIMHIEKFHTAAKKKRKDIYNEIKRHELTEKATILQLERDNEDVRSGNVEKSDLNNKISFLENQMETAVKKEKSLSDKITELEGYNLELNSTNEFISTQEKKIKRDYDRLFIKNERLFTEYNELSEKNKQLSLENERLSLENENLIIDKEQSMSVDYIGNKIRDSVTGTMLKLSLSPKDIYQLNLLNEDIAINDKEYLKTSPLTTALIYDSTKISLDSREKLVKNNLIEYLNEHKNKFKFTSKGLYFLKEILK